ncbi:hypothetical protein TNCV_3260661 [Trichonephila clavipes]|nr:hypothetical protein TNCV_3260661 [Trichonephila clavipes]
MKSEYIIREESDENVIRVENSDSSSSGFQASSFEGVRPRSDRTQNSRNSESGPTTRTVAKSPRVAEQCDVNIKSINQPTTRIQATGKSLDARVDKSKNRSQGADDQIVRVYKEAEDPDSKEARM